MVLGVMIPLGAWICPLPIHGVTCATAGLPMLRHKHARTAPRIFIGV